MQLTRPIGPSASSRRRGEGASAQPTTLCHHCPRDCGLADGGHGVCGCYRRNGETIEVAADGLLLGFRVEPIEAFDLNHVLPGTMALAVGRGGSNLGCGGIGPGRRPSSGYEPLRRGLARQHHLLAASEVADLACDLGCRTVALGATDPAVFPAYASAIANAARRRGLWTVMLSRGLIHADACAALFAEAHGARIELLGFGDQAYRPYAFGFAPIARTLRALADDTGLWLELALRLWPGRNDSELELERLSRWVVANLGATVPIHFKTAHLRDLGRPHAFAAANEAADRAADIAQAAGVHHVYRDDLFDASARTTWCHRCGGTLIRREWYQIVAWRLTTDDRCPDCGALCPGLFEGGPRPLRPPAPPPLEEVCHA